MVLHSGYKVLSVNCNGRIDKLQKGQTSKTVTTRKAHASDVRNNAMAKASDVTPDFQGLWDHMTQRGKHPVLMTI